MKDKVKSLITFEMIDAWSYRYAKEELITNHLEEFEELKTKYINQLSKKYGMKLKYDIVSLQIKNLIYICEDEPKENLIIVYEKEGESGYVKIDSFIIPLEAIESWCEE